MFSFSGWSLWGNLAAMLYSQGLNMMLNIFFGPMVNAARGIALQVQGVVQGFVGNFQIALNPQITKNYASGALDQMHNLMFRSARFSFFLLFLLALPILIEANYILHLWLGGIPDDTVVFMRWIIGVSLIYTIANPCMIANQATGKVKVYQAVVGGILLLILPASYVVLLLGAPAYSVFIVHFCVECIAQFARMYMLRNLINLPLRAYIKNIYVPILMVVIVSVFLPIIVHLQLVEGFIRFICVGIVCLASVVTTIFFLGLTNVERHFFIEKIQNVVFRRI
jgi:O-antigen/teichoic acid export membrane protein